jgi:hypothetical protein
MNRRIRAGLLTGCGAGLTISMLTACGGGSSTASPPSAPVSSPTASTAATGPVAPPPAPAATLSAQQVSDRGLPSHVGAGKLSKPTIKKLMQFFETKVGKAYATGNADSLSHYLAGPMLSGNRATIGLLTTKHKRNVFRIHVETVKPQTNEAHHLIFNMTGDMTVNYFFDPATHKVLDNGLPGPSQVQFTVFLDQNPKTGTWYWTGEKADATTGDTG